MLLAAGSTRLLRGWDTCIMVFYVVLEGVPGPSGTTEGIRNFYSWNPGARASEVGRRTMRACPAYQRININGRPLML
jgi:hypothetical protein